ncbi:MAG: ribosome silencing factor [Treponema sp.]|jgi:ribosome-associated protein|nr:ribosome silencing factor [Treponema sp.]
MTEQPAASADETLARGIAAILAEHRAQDAVVMDLRNLNLWTDFFVLATVSSSTHLSGLERQVKDFCAERGIALLRRSPRGAAGDEWRVIDLGSVVIHLMSAKIRAFYELERLWHEAPVWSAAQ